VTVVAEAEAEAFPVNIMHFARILRRAGLPLGSGKIITAIKALQFIDISRRDDFYWGLYSVFVERHSQSELFKIAFDRFWKSAESATENPMSNIDTIKDEAKIHHGDPLPQRLSEAFRSNQHSDVKKNKDPEIVRDATATWSSEERLRVMDFDSMTIEESRQARRLIGKLKLPIQAIPTRRFSRRNGGRRIDMRATFRRMIRNAGAIDLRRKQRVARHPPLVALCDVSGSMESYSRMLLHFLHAVTNSRDRVCTFVFGTRLTNITRQLAHRDPDESLKRVGLVVKDWSGGTRIGHALGDFNRLWSRRVLGQGAVVMLITDGLDRDGGEGLAKEMELLQRSCRRLIWLNPLLRYDRFQPKPAGIKAMLPFVDDFRPVHNLSSLDDLAPAFSCLNAGARRHTATEATL